MKRNEMIKNKKDFTGLIHSKNFHKSDMFVIYIRKSNLEKSHFGIAISKQFGTAVARNKAKRQTRYLIDQNRFLFPKYQDYIIMIRNKCASSTFQQMEAQFIALLKGINKK